jgi:hypothetical protein
METLENQGFLTTLKAMGLKVAIKAPSSFQIVNKINGFEQVS